jgi:hypothetical protein
MNFFGHAWVAAWFCDSAARDSEPFLLGAMLPDLASALRTAVPAARHADLAAGIRLHHETDRVFHATSTFQSLEHRARLGLSAAGLSKGPRRALAHIGIEFLIDDELGPSDERAAVTAGYAAALRFGAHSACRPLLHWSNTLDADRFAHLCQRLVIHAEAAQSEAAHAEATRARASHPPPRHDADRRLAARLITCLAGRPRLELQPREEAALEPWLAACRPAVAAATPSLLGELAVGLEAPAPSARLAAAE